MMPTVILPGGSQFDCLDFLMLVLVVMDDQFVRIHLGRVLDEISRQLGFAHFRQVRRVGGIVAADDQQQIQRFVQQFFQRVLPILRRAANRVEETEMLVDFGLAVFLDHGGLQAALHFLGFAAQHGGLVRHADGLQMHVRIESFANKRL